jgi:2-phosphoglycerate kinase
MIYLIGGPPRVGKTTLVKYLVQRHPMHAVSTDAIRYMLRRSVPREALDPDIFLNFHEDVMATWKVQPPEVTLDEQNRQSKAYWKALEELINSYDVDGVDVIIEGVAILPEFASSLKVLNKSIFMGNLAEQHKQIVMTQARENTHDWMHSYSDEELVAATDFFALMSAFVRDEAEKHGTMYAEIRDDNFEHDLQLLSEQLVELP